MKYTKLITLFLLSLSSPITPAHTTSLPDDVPLRYHAQWTVDEATQKKIHEAYGIIRFDPKGHPILTKLTKAEKKYWEMHFKHCMGDGCYYCDSAEGSCESRTCGQDNKDCKARLDGDGQPICGNECANYALKQLCQL